MGQVPDLPIAKPPKLRLPVPSRSKRIPALIAIKLLHTAIWLFFAGCIVALPFAGAGNHFWLAAILSGIVLIECAVIVFNRGRCPLTDLAARYTPDRRDNFDIYLPVWLARHNKTIFGTIFVLGGLFTLVRWLLSTR